MTDDPPRAVIVTVTHRPTTAPGHRARRGRLGSASRTLRTDARLGAFALPAILWFVAFMLVPLASMLYISLLDWSRLTSEPSFIGLGNFERLLSDRLVAAAVRNSAVQIVTALVIMMPTAFALGFFLSLRPPGHRLLAAIFFTPSLASAAARSLMFLGVFLPDGILNSILRAAGLDELTVVWLANTSTALPSIIAIELWAGIGFNAVILAAAIRGIPPEIYEAARIDGASTIQIMRSVAFPMLRGFVGVLTMLQFLWLLLGSAQTIILLTGGGPGESTMTLSYLLYDQAFLSSRLGFSQAIGVALFIVGLIGMIVIRRAFRPTY